MRAGLATIAAAGLVLAACVAPQTQRLDPEQARSLRVVDVTVEAAPAAAAEPRGFNASEAVLESIAVEQVRAAIVPRSPEEGRPVILAVTIQRAFVPNVGSAIVGRSGAAIEASAQLRDAATGAPLADAFSVRGGGGTRLGSVVGATLTAAALARGGERGELERAARALGANAGVALYGDAPAP